MNIVIANHQDRKKKRLLLLINNLKKSIRKNWDLYLLFLPVLTFFIIFRFLPMYGLQIAFKDFSPFKGIAASSWVGFKHFERFFRSYYFTRLLKNTLGISVYYLVVGFPVPIIFALMLNEVKSKYFKKTLQMVTYAPHFLSTVVLVGMLTVFLSPRTGIVNLILQSVFKIGPISFMTEPAWFKTIYVFSGIWQNFGWQSIIYIAVLASVPVELYEAATMDGATKLQRIRYIMLPAILPTAIILLIMSTGRVMNIGFEKVFLMQNEVNMEASDIISTYVYTAGLLEGQYSFSSAVGLFKSVINFILILSVNKISKKVTNTSLW